MWIWAAGGLACAAMFGWLAFVGIGMIDQKSAPVEKAFIEEQADQAGSTTSETDG